MHYRLRDIDAVSPLPNSPLLKALVYRGFENLKAAKWTQANGALTELIQMAPDYSWAYSARGLALAFLGKHSEAVADLTEAVRLGAQDDATLTNRAIAKCGMGLWKEAIADFDKVLEHPPQSPRTFMDRGDAYLELGDSASALQDYLKARDLLASRRPLQPEWVNVELTLENLIRDLSHKP